MTTREFAKNLFSQWSDEDFCAQPVFDKLLFQVLNGQRGVNAAGIQPINFTRWCKAMRDGDRVPSVGTIREALARMESRGFVYTDEDTGEVLIRSRIRRDELDKQPTMFLAALRILVCVDSPKFASVLAAELDRLVVPEVKGESPYSKRLRDSLGQTHEAAREHLRRLGDGFRTHLNGPTLGGSPGGSKGDTRGASNGESAGPSPRPGEMQTTLGGSPGGSKGPSGSGSVSGSGSSFVVGHLGGTREPDAETTDPTAGPGPRNEPPKSKTSEESSPPPPYPYRCRKSGPTGQPGPKANPLGPDAEPPTRCRKHAGTDDDPGPCGPCANFRKAHDRWAEREHRRQAQAASTAAHQAAELRTAAIEACGLCDADGYLPTRVVCDHVDRVDTNARGMAACRAALTKPDPETETETVEASR